MKLLFLPIDIDVSGLENFKQLDSTNTIISPFTQWWDSSSITDETVKHNNFNRVLNQLPFTRITGLTYKIQNEEVPAHIDVNSSMPFEDGEAENILANEPAGYRFVIKGQTDKVEVYNGREWVVAHIPSTPCCYVLNSTTGKHKVAYDPNREIIYARGFVDPVAHKQLLERSLEKFKQYAIYSK